ncbi:hypothetical protein C8J56DRAFT_169847 [Mycena floridula]|nr:hypothetical protein C8J56DRAFT_169847 [Mycena floridula]
MAPKWNSSGLSMNLRFPDDESTKDVILAARGTAKGSDTEPRHVFIYWENCCNNDQNVLARQVVQLEKHGDTYVYLEPNIKLDGFVDYETRILGQFTRDQREKILELAADVEFAKRSLVNGSRVWTRKLLGRMVDEQLIGLETFLTVVDMVPLPREQAEQ